MTIIFLPEAYRKFRAYIHLIDYEISGFGKVRKEGNDLIVEDVKIFDQVVNGGSTEIDAFGDGGSGGYAKFWDDLAVAGEDASLWKLWWHSHVTMPAFFSGTDRNTINDWDTEQGHDNWMLSIVTNKYGAINCQVDIFQPLRCSMYKLPWKIAYNGKVGKTDYDAIRKEIAEKVIINHPEEDIEIVGPPDSEAASYCLIPSRTMTGLSKPLSVEEKRRLVREYPELFPNDDFEGSMLFGVRSDSARGTGDVGWFPPQRFSGFPNGPIVNENGDPLNYEESKLDQRGCCEDCGGCHCDELPLDAEGTM
jgi:hypothetical protein